MPELPEVETIVNGLKPHLEKQIIRDVTVRHPRLRWPIPENLHTCLNNKKILSIVRKAKYILIQLDTGTLIIHLGMSGRLRVLPLHTPAQKHDHVDIHFTNQTILRYTDPRRFGAMLWTNEPPQHHPLLHSLGVEPLEKQCNHHYLMTLAHQRKTTIKSFIMNSHIIVGVGNIYACEALFQANIHPQTPAGLLKENDWISLVDSIQSILKKAIKQGGTTLKDFVNSDGKPGYFKQKLLVYGKENQPCSRCKTTLSCFKINQRSTYFCSHCQTLPESTLASS